jgi:hypothetical protein
MPKLKSGRHVGLSADQILTAINFGTDESIYAAILAYRLNARTPAQLRDFLAVAYYREGEGEPPHAPAYDSGFLVKDVLDGKAGWAAEEVADLQEWMDTNPRFSAYLEETFDRINEAIQSSLVWTTELGGDAAP